MPFRLLSLQVQAKMSIRQMPRRFVHIANPILGKTTGDHNLIVYIRTTWKTRGRAGHNFEVRMAIHSFLGVMAIKTSLPQLDIKPVFIPEKSATLWHSRAPILEKMEILNLYFEIVVDSRISL
jgi:hypothetical protein